MCKAKNKVSILHIILIILTTIAVFPSRKNFKIINRLWIIIFNIPNKQNNFELHYLYWIPKIHKSPYKQRYIAGSSKCSTKPLSYSFDEFKVFGAGQIFFFEELPFERHILVIIGLIFIKFGYS